MRIAVDLPAPFSPTIACTVPLRMVRLTRSFASTEPNRFDTSRSSSIGSVLSLGGGHRVGHGDLSRDDPAPGLFDFRDHLGRNQIAVVLVDRVTDPVVVESVDVNAGLKAPCHELLDDLVDGIVDPLDHAGQDVPGLDPV